MVGVASWTGERGPRQDGDAVVELACRARCPATWYPEVPREAYVGNDTADDAAGKAAKRHEVPEAVAKQQMELEEMAGAVLRRLVYFAMEGGACDATAAAQSC